MFSFYLLIALYLLLGVFCREQDAISFRYGKKSPLEMVKERLFDGFFGVAPILVLTAVSFLLVTLPLSVAAIVMIVLSVAMAAYLLFFVAPNKFYTTYRLLLARLFIVPYAIWSVVNWGGLSLFDTSEVVNSLVFRVSIFILYALFWVYFNWRIVEDLLWDKGISNSKIIRLMLMVDVGLGLLAMVFNLWLAIGVFVVQAYLFFRLNNKLNHFRCPLCGTMNSVALVDVVKGRVKRTDDYENNRSNRQWWDNPKTHIEEDEKTRTHTTKWYQMYDYFYTCDECEDGWIKEKQGELIGRLIGRDTEKKTTTTTFE